MSLTKQILEEEWHNWDDYDRWVQFQMEVYVQELEQLKQEQNESK